MSESDRHSETMGSTGREDGETMSDGTQSPSADTMGDGHPQMDSDTMSDEDDRDTHA